MHEAILLRMTDEEWKQYRAPVLGSGTTGDAIVDQWERDLERGAIDIHEVSRG